MKRNIVLIGMPGCGKTRVREVLSHPQALSQCAGFTRAHGWKATAKPNTAMAAKEVARQRRPDLAAYSSEMTAKLYGLEILQRAVQDAGNNYTRFIVISRELMIPPGADRVSLSLTLPHPLTGKRLEIRSRQGPQFPDWAKFLPETS